MGKHKWMQQGHSQWLSKAKKKKDKTDNPLKTIIFVLASSGNFVHPMKKISQTKSRVTECQTCLRWIIIECAISRGSCARMLTQNIQRRCPDTSVTVKDLLACSWHLCHYLGYLLTLVVPNAEYMVLTHLKNKRLHPYPQSRAPSQSALLIWELHVPTFPAHQESSWSSAWSTLQRVSCEQFWTFVCSKHWHWVFEVGNYCDKSCDSRKLSTCSQE